ncbi:MAG: hypothetical protein M3345_01515 [Actinomycetota bacterium]|nr:hypothetical protein [Actinomycetota bacterium]
MAATATAAAVLLVGTLWGQDDHFPFGPFRMYSTTTTDEVVVLRFEAVASDGRELDIRSRDFGLRRAEVAGQIAAFPDDDDLLPHLVQAYENLDPNRPPLSELRLVKGIHRLEGGRPVGYREFTLATWQHE